MSHLNRYSCHDIDDEDVRHVVDVLRSDFLTQGPKGPEFEEILTLYSGSRYAVALSSGSAALHCACAALGVTSGDLVWTSAISFVASANCARHLGATVDFVDIELATGNICIDELEQKLEQAKRHGKIPKVIIPVHFAGRPSGMRRIFELSKNYGFSVIEDASHSLGASYESGEKVGSCAFSDTTVFSFHPVKSITTGEGGLVTTNNRKVAELVRRYVSHGITRVHTEFTDRSNPDWYYEQQLLGFNYRLTDIQAALGISQMGRLDSFIEKRRKIAAYYQAALSELESVQLPPRDQNSSWHLYPLQVLSSPGRNSVYLELKKQGIGVNVHYIPIPSQPYYRSLGFTPERFPKSQKFASRAISIPIHTKLAEVDLIKIVSALRAIWNNEG